MPVQTTEGGVIALWQPAGVQLTVTELIALIHYATLVHYAT